jgi:catechol 2,3-dioxygenase-like lactoylglutathione lyase family enzyme
MDHVGVVVDDMASAIEFFVELGLEVDGEWPAEGAWVDRIIGTEGMRADCAMLKTPDGHNKLELVKFHAPEFAGDKSPQPSNAIGIRHLCFGVDDLDDTLERLAKHGAELVGTVENYEDIYRLCYVRGPAEIIVEIAEKLG